MAHTPKQQKIKWDKKSQEMLLVGYSETTKAYRLYNTMTNNAIVCRDVTIMENLSEDIQVVVHEDQHEP